MSMLLEAARDVHDSSGDQPSELLTELSTQHRRKQAGLSSYGNDDLNHASTSSDSSKFLGRHALTAGDVVPEDILEALRSQPDTACLNLILKTLKPGGKGHQSFDICVPGPFQAQIVQVLVNTTLPTFWPLPDSYLSNHLIACLRSVAGIKALIARLRLSLQAVEVSRARGDVESLDVFLSALHRVLDGEDNISMLWADITQADTPTVKRELVWKEVIDIVASGKIIAVAAQTEDSLKAHDKPFRSTWLSKGSDYAMWLGQNTISLLYFNNGDREAFTTPSKSAAQLLTKALSLGYPSPLMHATIQSYLNHVLDRDKGCDLIRDLLEQLVASSRRRFWEHVLRWLSTGSWETDLTEAQLSESSDETSGVAALLSMMAGTSSSSASLLVSLMSDPSFLSSISFTIRRAVIAVISQNFPDELETLLDRLIKQFGNRIFINHAPMIQQESLTQVLLLTAGYLHRHAPMAVLMSARSSGHMQSVSSRLETSSQRSRWLGMVSGVALSSLVDKEGSRMSFGTDDMDTRETVWYSRLVQVSDTVGNLLQLRAHLRSCQENVRPERNTVPSAKPQELPIINGKRVFGPPRPPAVTQDRIIGERVTEVFDGREDSEVTDLRPYAKPDSDREDSDEDATLVNRSKPKAPVYVRDLMRMLRDDKNHDRFQLGVKHAATLIRRKANFGTEVKDHAEELAAMLCNLQDPFNTEDFDELRLQALIAVLLTDVAALAPWLSRRAFSGDYSLSQRCIILSALGLGGRELAGFNEDYQLNPDLLEGGKHFPTKRLPGHLHAIYSPEDSSTRRLEAMSKHAENQLIKPLALSAADKTTSHLDAVKVRAFSSRIDAERTRRKPVANELAKTFAESFFYPLVTRYQQEIAAYGAGSVFASAPFVLVTFVKTLALLLHASGPATLSLPEITSVFWDFLLCLRMQAVADISVLEAVLFALLTLFEVNDGSKQRLARETPKQLVETQQWVETVFDNLGGSELVTEGSEEESRVRALAAGVLVKAREVVETYQKLLVGNVSGLW